MVKRKSCERGKIRNPRSGRCVKKDGKVGQAVLKAMRTEGRQSRKSRSRSIRRSRSKSCERGKILNPRSGRCVKKDGKIGQAVLRAMSTKGRQSSRSRSIRRSRSQHRSVSYSHSPSSPLSPVEECDEDEVLNTRNGRCVDKESAMGKRLMKIYQKEFLEKYGSEIIPRGYEINKVLGSGIQGTVYELKSITYADRLALKLQDSSSKSLNEMKVHRRFSDAGLGPKIISTKVSLDPPISAIVMETIDNTMENYLDREVSTDILDGIIVFVYTVINKMCSDNLIHGDLHWENFGYRLEYGTRGWVVRPLLIDFGSSVSGVPCNPKLELLQLLRTLAPAYRTSLHPKNAKYLHNQLHRGYTSKLGPLKKSFKTYEKLYSDIIDDHYNIFSYI